MNGSEQKKIKDRVTVKRHSKKWAKDGNVSRLINKSKVNSLLHSMGMRVLDDEFYDELARIVHKLITKAALRSIDNYRTAIRKNDL